MLIHAYLGEFKARYMVHSLTYHNAIRVKGLRTIDLIDGKLDFYSILLNGLMQRQLPVSECLNRHDTHDSRHSVHAVSY